jgi:Ca2+-binding EF-hand superfamily protein
MVSLSEYQQAAAEIAAKRFARLDTNGDGQLTPDELQAARRHGPGRRPPLERFKKIDTDGDGSLSLAELQAVHPNMTAEQFNRLDRNSDGLIEPGELRGGHRFSGAR